ncbi:hypothetical protein PENTCL1PPCAC_22137, partial [Pristionchus entomophagus]
PPPNLLKSAPSESLFVIPARRSRSMSEKPSMRAARMPELPEDSDVIVVTGGGSAETPGISLAQFETPIFMRERERKQSTVAVDDPHGEQQVPHDSPHSVHSPKKATPRQLKRRSQELEDLISFTDDVSVERPEFLEMVPPPEHKVVPESRPVPAPRTTTPTSIGSVSGSNPIQLMFPDPNISTGSSPTLVVDEHRLRIVGLDDFDLL